MRQVIRWETDDGSLFKRRADAVAHERRKRRAACSFLLDVPAEELTTKTGRLPAGTWIDAGYVLYSFAVGRVDTETAIARALRRCLSLRDRTGLDWRLDEGMLRDGNEIYIGNNAALKSHDVLH